MLKTFLKPTNAKRVTFFLMGDIFISLFTIYISFLLRFNFDIPVVYQVAMEKMAIVLIPLKIFFLFYFHLYFVVWRFFGFVEYKKLIYAHLLSYAGFAILFFIFQQFFSPFPRSVIGIDLFLSLALIGFFRTVKRFFLEKGNIYNKKALIYGANKKTATLVKSAINGEITYYIEAILDDEYSGNYFSDIPVYHTQKLEKLATKYDISALLLTDILPQKELDLLVKRCHETGIKEIKKTQLLEENDSVVFKNISVEDLLARHPKDLDKTAIKNFIKDKIILITGAGGSIGSELARQCVNFGAKKLLLLDHSEYNLYKIEQELEDKNIIPIMKNITNKESLEKTFKSSDIDIVLHAAAYKHVPLVEANVEEAVFNNILGTKNCMDLAIKYGVKKFVMISTDKAVRPTNVMGATKRVCELYGQNIPSNKTEIVSVRFGNVLGSSGSVIPKFTKQIKAGGPITVTHPEIIRYFMLIPEACQLVLQAAYIGKKGELFILDMGKPVKIVNLAKKMIELSGISKIQIVFTGLRPGEKLYEELLRDKSDVKTKYQSILISKKTDYDIEKLQEDIKILLKNENKISQLKKIVPDFQHED